MQTATVSDFLDADAMQKKHEFPLYDIFFCSHPFGILYYGLTGLIVGIDKVGDVLAGSFHAYADRLAFEVGAAFTKLRRDKDEGNLLTEVGDDSRALPHLECVCAVVLLLRSVSADTLCAIFIGLAWRTGTLLYLISQLSKESSSI